jgi:hypothetical protein
MDHNDRITKETIPCTTKKKRWEEMEEKTRNSSGGNVRVAMSEQDKSKAYLMPTISSKPVSFGR